jgi:predicted PurR-regulated permease PerM
MVRDSSYAQVTRWVLIAIIVIVILAVLWTVRNIVLLTFASVILVVFFTIPVRFLARFGVRRTPAILASVIGISLIISLLVRLVLPTLVEQFATLATVTIPNGVNQIAEQWNSGEFCGQSNFFYETVCPFLETIQIDQSVLNDLPAQIATAAGQIGGAVLPVVGDVATSLLSILILLFLSLYFLADPNGYTEGFIKLFPLSYRHRARYIVGRVNFMLRRWLEGTIISMMFVGLGTWIGLALLNIQQAAALGVIAGILSFVPNFGQLIAVAAAIVVGIVQAPENLLLIVLVLYGMSFVQSQIFSPILFSESINLPPVLVLVGQIICGALFGFMGIVLAVPLTATFLIIVQEVYIKDFLGDTPRDTSPVIRTSPDEELLADPA